MALIKKLLRSNKGFSLIELIISIAIMSIITAGIGAAVVSATRNYSRGTSEVDIQTNAQNITNIITNLIVDSAKVSNDASGGCTEGGCVKLYITSITGDCYIISYEEGVNSNGTGTIYYSEGKSYDLCTDKRVLSENVTTFNADAYTYSKDYTVYVTIGLNYPSENRSYDSTFSATSRNAAGAGAYIDSLDGAVVVCDTMCVIEPNEGYENGKTSLALDCKVITSGSVNEKGFNFYVLKNKDDNISEALTPATCGLTVTKGTGDDDGKLLLSANEYLSPNSAGCLYIKVVTEATDASGNAYDSKFITVNVRKVSVATISKDKDASSTSTNQAGDVHVVIGKLDTYNPDRFYALDSDQDYSDPDTSIYDVVWTVNCKGKNGNNIDYYLASVTVNGTDILSQLKSSDGYSGTSGEKFTITLKNSLPKGEVITFTMTPVHNQGIYKSLVTNKASLAKYNGGTAVAKQYHCDAATYKISAGFFDEISDYQRGTVLNKTGFGDCTGAGVFNEIFKDKYDEYKALLTAQPDGSDSYGNKYADVVAWLEDFRDNKITYKVYYFYRIKDYTLDIDGSSVSTDGWSQYRVMGEDTNFDFNKAANPSLSSAGDLSFTSAKGGTFTTGMTNRLNGDTYQSVEFVVTIMDKASGTIYWPYYTALDDYGFGDYSKHCGLNYKFSNIAKSITDDYSSYATCFDVVPASITYSANTTLGTEAGNTVGSTSDPVILGDGLNTSFSYDQANWVGLDYKEYQNLFSGILMKNDGNGWEVATDRNGNQAIFGLGDGLSSEIQCAGGFKVGTVNTSFYIDTQNGGKCEDTKSTYRIVPICYNFKLAYIRDEDQAFSDKTYWDTDHLHTYMMVKGELDADPLASTITFRRYGLPKTISLFLNDNSDSTPYSVEYVEKQGFTSTLPVPTRKNYEFNGWFTASEGGDLITDSTKTLSVSKLYAQWDDITGLTCNLKLVSTVDEGWATTYNYRLYNYNDTGKTLIANFSMSSDISVGDKSWNIITTDPSEWTCTTYVSAHGYVDLYIKLKKGTVDSAYAVEQ